MGTKDSEVSRGSVGVVGAGYVGLVTAVCLASLGHEVTVRGIDERKIATLRAGQIPIWEPGLAEMLRENVERIQFTRSMRELLDRSEFIFIAVDTPPTHSGDADLSRVRSVARRPGHVPGDL
jgi:UDPglucose 6-dehydrogenase